VKRKGVIVRWDLKEPRNTTGQEAISASFSPSPSAPRPKIRTIVPTSHRNITDHQCRSPLNRNYSSYFKFSAGL